MYKPLRLVPGKTTFDFLGKRRIALRSEERRVGKECA